MNESRETRIKRLIYQSWYRGCKETDILLGRFARAQLSSCSDAELDIYEALLEENDNDLFDWLTGKAPCPQRYHVPLVDRLLAFDASRIG